MSGRKPLRTSPDAQPVTTIEASDYTISINGTSVNPSNISWVSNVTMAAPSTSNIYFGQLPSFYNSNISSINPCSNVLIGDFVVLNKNHEYDSWDNTGSDFYNKGPPTECLSVGGDALIQNKLGVGTLSPTYEIDVTGDINLTGDLRINGVAQTFSSFVEGSEGIHYPSSGTTKRVAINTTYATRYLDVAGTINSSNGGILIRNGDTNSGAYYAPQIAFGLNGTNTYQHFIQTRHSSSVSQNAIDFYVCDSTQANYLGVNGGITHNLTLEAGNVGIGTLSPKARLHVRREGSSGESNVYIQAYSDDGDDGGNRAALFLGTPYVNSTTAQPKCAIIADAVGWSRANLHFCVETSQDNGSAYRASKSNSRMMIDGISGNVGIGTISPTQAKLAVSGTGSSTHIGAYALLNSSGSIDTIGSTEYSGQFYSIHTTHRIACSEINLYSDSRIKKNVVDINDSSALDKIRLLEPKIYNYIDEKQKGTSNVYGFIAQEVANVLPYAVTVSEGDIPNILTNSNVSVTSDSNVLELRLDTTVEGLTLSNTSNINITTDNDQYLTVPVLSFSGSNVITIQNSDKFTNVTGAYIHGEHIQDFNNLNKDAIWAVSTAALQEVDRQLQAEKTKVVTLETQVADLIARVTALENN